MKEFTSWGRTFHYHHTIWPISWRDDTIPFSEAGTAVLPYGLGRSYGDSCLNDGAILLDASHLNHFIHFDEARGWLTCEAGVTLEAILQWGVPRGWFLPVSPGTKFVTVGGAIANDIHGKNHHRGGTFGCHVVELEILTSDGQRRHCSPVQNVELFQATIGGLGLTGLILSATIKLKSVKGPWIDEEIIKFEGLEEFFEVSKNSDEPFEYTVAWIDPVHLRGLFMRGNHSEITGQFKPSFLKMTVPCDSPIGFLKPWSIRLFNEIYFDRQREKVVRKTVSYEPFFYPLDGVGNWNRLYGKRGFFQYQCVVPVEEDFTALKKVFETIQKSGANSFLTVLKMFGEKKSPGLLSFPRKGATLAIDFSNEGAQTLQMMERLDEIVRDHGGAVYPAKDARMSGESFRQFFPRWEEFAKYKDPKFSSSFWRRVVVHE